MQLIEAVLDFDAAPREFLVKAAFSEELKNTLCLDGLVDCIEFVRPGGANGRSSLAASSATAPAVGKRP